MPIIFDGHLTEPALPRPTINTVAGDDIISSSEQSASITGTAAAGATVMLSFGTGHVTVAANAYGQWSYNLQAVDLAAMQVPGVQHTIILARTQLADGTVSYPASRDVHVETAAPQLAVAAVNKNVLMLGYQTLGWLYGTVAVSDYQVKVNGEVVDISMAERRVEGREAFVNKVMLTLVNPITASDAVTVSYKAGPSGLRDQAGNQSADYIDQRVSNVTGDTAAPSAPLKLEVVTATGSSGSGLYGLDAVRSASVRVWLDTKSATTAAVAGDALVLTTGENSKTKVLLTATDIAKGYVDFPTFLRTFGPYASVDAMLDSWGKAHQEARQLITASLTDAALNQSATSPVLKVMVDDGSSGSLTTDKSTSTVIPAAGKADREEGNEAQATDHTVRLSRHLPGVKHDPQVRTPARPHSPLPRVRRRTGADPDPRVPPERGPVAAATASRATRVADDRTRRERLPWHRSGLSGRGA